MVSKDRRKVILIAEDEPDVVRLLAFHLQRAGYRVAHAGDGLAAINSVFEEKPDLVLLDGMLPKLHGFEVCRMIKSSPTSRRMPVIIVTALASMDDKLKGFGCGADDYVTKPFEIPELLARIQQNLERQPAER
jgi:two-component system phosphate regulon response regulator PhoB